MFGRLLWRLVNWWNPPELEAFVLDEIASAVVPWRVRLEGAESEIRRLKSDPAREERDRAVALLGRMWKAGAVDRRIPSSVQPHCRYCLQFVASGDPHDAECPFVELGRYARHA